MISKLIWKMRKRRFCKLNGWFCPDCIYHDFIFEGEIFRGNRCRYPRQTERIEALSAEAEPKMTEEVREALMQLTMCAREECDMCKYKDKCGFEFQYNISTENMHTILEKLESEVEE